MASAPHPLPDKISDGSAWLAPGMQNASMDVRFLRVTDTLRYAQSADRLAVEIDGWLNYHHVTSAPGRTDPRLMLEKGINPVRHVDAPDGTRRPVVAIRSSPWKAGHESNPWHDEFDLDHGHVRYYGDHKPTPPGDVGSTAGNRALLELWRSHYGTSRADRLNAAPLVIFRSQTITSAEGRAVHKGHVEFCGAAVIERLEMVVQRDPASGRSFPNLVLDLAVLDLKDTGDSVDWRWIDDRRDPELTAEQTLRHAPAAWRKWVDQGRVALPRIRRRVLSSRVLTPAQQQPDPGSPDEAALAQVYRYFDDQKHSFEMLAAKVAAAVLGQGGSSYHEGWLTRAGGDGGLDFVGRLDVGSSAASTPLIVLGQAKCIVPTSSVSPDQVARVVARLQRGWLGVFVTTGSFSRQAQVEVIDDQYPLVLIAGRRLAEEVRKMAFASHGGDIGAVLDEAVNAYAGAVTSRRPSEVLQA